MTPREFTTRFASAKGTYGDGRCFTVGLHTVPGQVYTAVNISQEFLGNEGAECTCWAQEPWLTIS